MSNSGNSTDNNVMNSEVFFDKLDETINGPDDTDDGYYPVQPNENAKKTDNNADVTDDTEKRLANLEQRYESSSSEGRRLAKENERLAKQLEDASNNSTSNSPPPKNIKEFLKLGDDFVYDPQEAIDDPDSDSGRYRKAELALEVHRQTEERRAREESQSLATEQTRQKNELMKKFNLTDDDWDKFQEKVANSNITLEQTYLLFNPELVTDNAIRGIIGESNRHRQKISNFGNNAVVESGSGQENQSESGAVIFDKIFGIDNSKFKTVDEL